MPLLKKAAKLADGQSHYNNPRISFNGKHWFISVGIERPEEKVELTSTVLESDLGIKVLAYVSDGTWYPNINKSAKVRNLQKRLVREQRNLSRKERENIDHSVTITGKDGKEHQKPVYERPLRECRNYQKQKAAIQAIHRKLNDIRTKYVHQVTRDIVELLPQAIVMEDLQVAALRSNRKLAKAVSEQKWAEFRRQITYKAKMKGIDLRISTFRVQNHAVTAVM